jgi:hypothetical protein
VTVVHASTDVLEDDAPRRGWVWALGLVVVIVAAVVLSWVRSDRTDDRAAADALQLSVDSVTSSTGLVNLGVTNAGPARVQVLTARLTAPGYATEPVGAALEPGARLIFSLKDSATCGPQMADDPASSLELQVRTARGSTATRSLPLGASAFREVNHAARQRCGYLPADEAFRFEALTTRLQPGSVTIPVKVGNGSLFPMELSELLPLSGLELTVVPALPRELPAQASPNGPVRLVPLTITLAVRNCGVFTTSYERAASVELIRGRLVQQHATGFEVPVLTFDPTSSFVGPADPGAIATHLLRSCTP